MGFNSAFKWLIPGATANKNVNEISQSFNHKAKVRQHTYNVKLRRIRIVAMKKKKYSEGVFVALIFQHANRMHRIRLSPVVCLAVPYFSTFISLTSRFSNKVTEHKIYVLIFRTSFL
jgi:hypothetical protein